MTGYTNSADFPTTAGAFDTTSTATPTPSWRSSTRAAPPSSTPPTWAEAAARRRGIAVDAAGSAYLTGDTSSADFPTTAGAFDTTLGGYADAFVTKLDPGGAALGYSTYLGGSGDEGGDGIAVDGAGRRLRDRGHVLGRLPDHRGRLRHDLTAAADAFVTKLDASGAGLVYSTYLGGSDADGAGIAVDGAGSAYVTGYTRRRTSRRPRAPSTRPTAAASTPS